MKNFLSILMLIASSTVMAQNSQEYGQDLGGANSPDAELVSITGLPLTPEALRVLYALMQHAAQQNQK